MAARKKSGRITLRMDPEIHQRVEQAAKLLGMDINGLLNLIIRKGLPYWEGLAASLADPTTVVLLSRWLKLNPSSDIEVFYIVFSKDIGQPRFRRFEDGKLYRINDRGDDFVEITPEEERELKERKSHAAESTE